MRSRLPHDPPAHAGLALQRYLRLEDDQEARNQAVRKLLERIQDNPIPPVYKQAFDRWKAALSEALLLEATTLTPLAIGLGNPSPLENGLAIHHTYGVPYLPGSALKGLLRRAADRFGLDPQAQAVLFGEGPNPQKKSPGQAAYLVYWDGWLDPQSKWPFQKDVITVHHPRYYGGGAGWPSDFDDPNPVAFLSVRPGTRFWIAIGSSPGQEAAQWRYTAAELLRWGLEHLGLGGKTNAGYGSFEVSLPPKPLSEAELAEELYQTYKRRIEGINGRNARGEVSWFMQELRQHPPEVRRKTLEAILRHLENFGLQRERYYQSLKDLLS